MMTGRDGREPGSGAWNEWLQAALGLALSSAVATGILALGYWWLLQSAS
jgi:hypothetical protein